MTVKVMLAPSIAQREPKAREGSRRSEERGGRPKRRRALVYDAEGNEVFITLVCLKCQKIRPLSQFGLRKMADGSIRNQPWCRTCRTGASPEGPKRRRQEAVAGPTDRTIVEAGPANDASKVVDAGSLAAQVLAALHGGRR